MKYHLPTIILIFFCLIGFSQERPVKFDHLTAKEGLSQGHVLCMIQDSEGYIWAGTYHGLNRYNGYSIDVFYADEPAPYRIFIDVVFCLFEDRDGNIWCGTWGVDKYDKKTGTFTHYPDEGQPDNSLFIGEYSSITQDTDGNMWFGTQGGGVNKLDIVTGKVTHFTAEKSKLGGLRSDVINDLLIDRNQQMWIATEDGGLSRMNLSNHSIVTYSANPGNPYALPSNKISCLFEDKTGNIWIGDNAGHLISYLPESDNFRTYQFAPEGFDLNRTRIMEIDQDLKGNLLLATNGSGLIKYDYINQTSEVFLHNTFNENSIASNETYSLLVDNANTVFVGTFGRGISKYSPYGQKFQSFAIKESANIEGDVNAFTDAIEDANGNLVVGSYNGFFVFDQNTWNFKHYLPGDTYEENKILTLELAPDNTIWVSSMSSLHRYSENYQKIQSYRVADGLKDHSIYGMEFDHKHNLWVGQFTKGLYRIPESEWKNARQEKLKGKLYQLDYSDTTSISGNQQWMIMMNDSNELFTAGVGGVDKYNYETDDFTRVYNIPQITVKTFDFDQNGNIWMGTIGRGLHGYNLQTGETRVYTLKDGLPHAFIYSVVADTLNNLWITSEIGLSRFDIENGNFRNFDERDGLPDDHFDDKADQKLSNGRIYMGTNKGFIIFRPEEIYDDMNHGKVVLTSVEINNQRLEYITKEDKDTTYKIPVGQVQKIELDPADKDISFEFAALHFAAPHKIKYQYKLEGYDKEWIYTKANVRSAKYTNLDGGEYTLKVKATNSDGQWSDQSLDIKVIVHPPFHKTTGFKIIVSLTLILLFLGFFRYRISQEIKHRRVLAHLVEERTTEITNKNKLLEKIAEDLKETNTLLEERQQYIEEQSEELTSQRDELATTNATKDKLFSVIAHDLKNPFNVIIGYCDLLMLRLEEWDNDKKLYFLNLLKESSEGAFNLLENLLQWSRSQSGTIRFNPVPKRINELLCEVIPDVENFARKKDIQIKNLADHERFLIYVDVNMIITVYRNLISNAIKFSNSGQKIIINAEIKENNKALLSVQDQGSGMNEKELSNLFKLQSNALSTGTAGEKGTGIGLILCKDFIDHHKGEIWATSKPGEGSTFYFTVPLAK